jgi:hypothetical protein
MLNRIHKIAPAPKDGAHEETLQAAARALPPRAFARIGAIG